MTKTFSFKASMTPDSPMTAEELRRAEQALARLIAAAYAADHPELFGKEANGLPRPEVEASGNPDLDSRTRAGVRFHQSEPPVEANN